MTASALALQAALLARLRDMPALLAAPLAGRIHDAAPRDADFPRLVVDEVTTRDRSGLDAPLDEHRVALRIHGRSGGRREVLAIADAVEIALVGPLSLDGHRLVALRRETVESRILKDRLTAEAVVRLVVLTEPL